MSAPVRHTINIKDGKLAVLVSTEAAKFPSFTAYAVHLFKEDLTRKGIATDEATASQLEALKDVDEKFGAGTGAKVLRAISRKSKRQLQELLTPAL